MSTYAIAGNRLTFDGIGNRAQAGTSIMAARFVRMDEDSGKIYQAVSHESQAESVVVGLLLTQTYWTRQAAHYIPNGTLIDIGTGSTPPVNFLVPGRRLVLTTGGGMMDEADIAGGQWLVYLGTSISATAFVLDIINTGVQTP